jgi:hypothetical protein
MQGERAGETYPVEILWVDEVRSGEGDEPRSEETDGIGDSQGETPQSVRRDLPSHQVQVWSCAHGVDKDVEDDKSDQTAVGGEGVVARTVGSADDEHAKALTGCTDEQEKASSNFGDHIQRDENSRQTGTVHTHGFLEWFVLAGNGKEVCTVDDEEEIAGGREREDQADREDRTTFVGAMEHVCQSNALCQ